MPAEDIDAHRLSQAHTHSTRDTKGEMSILEMVPSALELVSPWGTVRQSLELISNAANTKQFLSLLTETQAELRAAGVPILVKRDRGARHIVALQDLTRPQRRWLGQLSLELYFTQLFRSESTVVDLGPSRLGIDTAGDAVWYPRPLYLRWHPEFLSALRDVYAGFFLGNSDRFGSGAKRLGLDSSGPLLLRHLGEGNQRGVRFSATRLQEMLCEMSALRSTGDRALHRNFIAFGLYVVSLHELLEALELAFDVRGAFMRSIHEVRS